MKSRLAVLAAIAFALFPATAASACPGTEVDEALEEAVSVFVGEVTATTDRDRIAEMRVVAVWKGLDLPEIVTVAGTFEEGGPVGADDARFTVGRQYLVVPENTRAPFVATKCSATTPIHVTGTLIPAPYQEAIGAEMGRSPLDSADSAKPSAGSNGTLGLGLAAAGIAASALGWLASRRSGAKRADMTEAPIEQSPEPESAKTGKHRLSLDGLLTRLMTPSAMKQAQHNRRKSRRLRARWERRVARRST
jgi:hypothetical protein